MLRGRISPEEIASHVLASTLNALLRCCDLFGRSCEFIASKQISRGNANPFIKLMGLAPLNRSKCC
jgi:hypothetical protein